MAGRLAYAEHSKAAMRKLYELNTEVAGASIEKALVDLVNVRVSQINGCVFCVDMHSKEAVIHGERPLRLLHLSVWKESPLFTEREKMAFEWSEAVTEIAGGVSDALYEKARAVFSEKELSDLTLVAGVINVLNRIGVAFLPTPGAKDQAYGIANSGLA